MASSFSRRRMSACLAGGAALMACARFPSFAQESGLRFSSFPAADENFTSALASLENKAGGRLGVALLDSGKGYEYNVGYNATERFAFCSTFKMPLAVMALEMLDKGYLADNRLLPITEADLTTYAPVTGTALAQGGMTVRDLAMAAIIHSDNVAANMLLKELGGPAGFTSWLLTQGDSITRLDDVEPALNSVEPGTVENTSAPMNMARLYARLLGNNAPLTPASRSLLKHWLIECQTGQRRLRAGLPRYWEIGDKTGSATGDSARNLVNKVNDVAVIWRPDGRLIIIAAFYETPGGFEAMRGEDDAILAQVGEIAHKWIGHVTS